MYCQYYSFVGLACAWLCKVLVSTATFSQKPWKKITRVVASRFWQFLSPRGSVKSPDNLQTKLPSWQPCFWLCVYVIGQKEERHLIGSRQFLVGKKRIGESTCINSFSRNVFGDNCEFFELSTFVDLCYKDFKRGMFACAFIYKSWNTSLNSST